MSIDMEDQRDHPNRVIIIQGPSQDSSLRAAATRTIDEKENTDIRSADVNALEAIRDDPSRSTYFWKLILPQGFELDNFCFSENHVDITKSTFIHTETIKRKNKKYDFHSMFAEWNIAKRGACCRVTPANKYSSY